MTHFVKRLVARNAHFRQNPNIPIVRFSPVRREIYIYIYIRVVRLFDGLAEIGAPR